jgi:hypothetical protein
MPLLAGAGAVLVIGVIALALFAGHHPAQGNAAVNTAGNTADNTAPAGPGSNAAPSSTEAATSLSDILAQLQNALIAQGAVAFEGFAHDSDPPAGKVSDWTYTKRMEYTDISLDPADCKFNFHFKLTVNGDVSDDKDAWVPLREVTTIKTAPETDFLQIRDAQAGHPTYSSRLQPTIYDVDVIRDNGGVNEFSFYSLESAHRVARLFEAAAERCGATISRY